MVWSIQRKKFCIDTEELIVNLGANLVSGSFLLLFDPFPIFAISFVILINSCTFNFENLGFNVKSIDYEIL